MADAVSLSLLIFYLTLESFAFVSSVIGNLMIVYVVLTVKKLERLSNKCIINVAIGDLLIGLFAIPTGVLKAVDNIPHDKFLCLYVSSFVIFIYAAEMMTVLVVSFDRLWAICFPISYLQRNHRLTTVLIIISWMIPVIIGVLPVLGMNGMDKFQNKCIVTTVMSFNHMFISSSYIIFVSAIMIVAYAIIYFRIIKQRNEQKLKKISGNQMDKSVKSEIRMAKTFGWIVATYIICYAPLTLNFLLVASTKNVKLFQENWILRLYHVFSICFAHFNSAFNPFIYAYRIRDVRNAMKEVVSRMCGGVNLKCLRKTGTEKREQKSQDTEDTV